MCIIQGRWPWKLQACQGCDPGNLHAAEFCWSLGPPGAPTIDEESLGSSVQAKLQTVQVLASGDTAVANHTQHIKSQFPGTIVMWQEYMIELIENPYIIYIYIYTYVYV